jgi:phage terminase large subunit-like protein
VPVRCITVDRSSRLYLAGRAMIPTHNTRSGAEWVRERVEFGGARRIHLVAPTAADVRNVMLEGPAGLLTISPPHIRPEYSPTLRRLTWPNGAIGLCFSGDEPDRLRGVQADTLWLDELCAMRLAQDVLDMAYMGLRLGRDPRALVTTTPRPIKPFKDLLAKESTGEVVVTRSSTFANKDNLAKPFLNKILAKYEGTRLGRQARLGGNARRLAPPSPLTAASASVVCLDLASHSPSPADQMIGTPEAQARSSSTPAWLQPAPAWA